MQLLNHLFYGFVSGVTELMPVSGIAHQQLTRYLLGMNTRESLLDFLVHIAIVFSIVIGSYGTLSRLRRERKRSRKYGSGGKHPRDMKSVYELRLVKTASVIMILGYLVLYYFGFQSFNLVTLTITFILTGIIGVIVDYMRHGNKDARHVSSLDAVGIGFVSALSAFPGISRIGMTLSYTTARGADRVSAYHWALLLSIPALVLMAVLDAVGIFTAGVGTVSFGLILCYFAAAAAAFAGGYAAITFMNYLAVRMGFSGIAYYNLGAGIFSFILYLIT